MHKNLLPIIGIEPNSTKDYPNKLSAVLFTQGCSFRCSYCHNADFAYIDTNKPTLSYGQINMFLQERINWLDAIVISGGEPTIHSIEALINTYKMIKNYDYLTGLHSNGYSSNKIEQLLQEGIVDFYGIDFKTTKNNYETLTHSNSYEDVIHSIRLIINNNAMYNVRTTYHPKILTEDMMINMIYTLASVGVKNYIIQKYHSTGVQDSNLKYDPTPVIPPNVISIAKKMFPNFQIR